MRRKKNRRNKHRKTSPKPTEEGAGENGDGWSTDGSSTSTRSPKRRNKEADLVVKGRDLLLLEAADLAMVMMEDLEEKGVPVDLEGKEEQVPKGLEEEELPEAVAILADLEELPGATEILADLVEEELPGAAEILADLVEEELLGATEILADLVEEELLGATEILADLVEEELPGATEILADLVEEELPDIEVQLPVLEMKMPGEEDAQTEAQEAEDLLGVIENGTPEVHSNPGEVIENGTPERDVIEKFLTLLEFEAIVKEFIKASTKVLLNLNDGTNELDDLKTAEELYQKLVSLTETLGLENLTMVIAGSFSVDVLNDATPEKDDMAKALALSKRFFWRNMMPKWACYFGTKIEPSEIGTKSIEELRKICENWKVKALAADAYPRFRVEHGQLQLSSAMEAIKAAYRVLFGWSKGSAPRTEIKFENDEAWDLVDRWINAFENFKSFEKQTAGKMLIEVNGALVEDAYFDLFKVTKFSAEFYNAPEKIESLEDNIQLLLAASNEVIYEETLPNGTHRNYLNELEITLKAFKKLNKQLLRKLKHEDDTGAADLKLMSDLKTAHEIYQNLWELIQELSLDMETMCAASKEYKTQYFDNLCVFKYLWLTKMKAEHFWDTLSAHFNSQPKHIATEIKLGPLLWVYKYSIHDPMVVKHADEMDELEPVLDSCVEAKLKVKGN
uniref:DHC_N2 domain-containing protein n=1 Tax=Globodera pallida TaxID=36090 RepID=A0A183C7X3_GLOPA